MIHPRVCGEYGGPHTPGLDRRFTPACAGNTVLAFCRKWHAVEIHPRVCGEYPLRPAVSKRKWVI